MLIRIQPNLISTFSKTNCRSCNYLCANQRNKSPKKKKTLGAFKMGKKLPSSQPLFFAQFCNCKVVGIFRLLSWDLFKNTPRSFASKDPGFRSRKILHRAVCQRIDCVYFQYISQKKTTHKLFEDSCRIFKTLKIYSIGP